MKKKAQDLGINTIILAAIGVLVLIILIAVFASNMGKQNKNINSATNGAKSIQNTLVAAGVSVPQLQKDMGAASTANGGTAGVLTAAQCDAVLVKDGIGTLKCSTTDTSSNTCLKVVGKGLSDGLKTGEKWSSNWFICPQ